MLQLRPNCECCNKDLPPESTEARICSFECTFCAICVDTVLKGVCPNCGGKLRKLFHAVYREIAYACRVPWIAANLDLYNHATAGAVASHKFVNGTVSTLFTLTNLHLVPISPAIDRGKQEVTLELSGFSTATGLTDGTLEMQIVSDSTV